MMIAAFIGVDLGSALTLGATMLPPPPPYFSEPMA